MELTENSFIDYKLEYHYLSENIVVPDNSQYFHTVLEFLEIILALKANFNEIQKRFNQDIHFDLEIQSYKNHKEGILLFWESQMNISRWQNYQFIS